MPASMHLLRKPFKDPDLKRKSLPHLFSARFPRRDGLNSGIPYVNLGTIPAAQLDYAGSSYRFMQRQSLNSWHMAVPALLQ